jgi:hypothetical protein
LQVDLFFYRDPEEAKEQEEEAAAAPEFAAITDYQGTDQWGGDQWTSDVAAPPVAPTGADWGAAPGIYGYLLLTFKIFSSLVLDFLSPCMLCSQENYNTDSSTLYRVTVVLT